jgi:uncharacterized protein YcbX
VHVSELYVYPIKSARGVALERAQLDTRGFQHDRRWMLVDDGGVFISQREAHALALVDVALSAGALTVSTPAMPSLRIPFDASGPSLHCRIWRDEVTATATSPEADAWFSSYLERSCRLVHMPDDARRIVDRTYVAEERIVGFADAFPLLIIGQGSLNALNAKLIAQGTPAVTMRRFRPNIVVAETAPHEEDEWRRIRVGDVDVDVVKPCARCVITTVDVQTGVAGREPLRTLATYRKRGSKVLFGQNAVHRQHGTIGVGDTVTAAGSRAAHQ